MIIEFLGNQPVAGWAVMVPSGSFFKSIFAERMIPLAADKYRKFGIRIDDIVDAFQRM